MKQFFVVKELTSDYGHNAKTFVVERTDKGCWECVSHASNRDGYIKLVRKEKHSLAHRLAYEVFVGEIPKGMCALHKCDNASCVNPDHLFLGTPGDNVKDMTKKGRGRGMFKQGIHHNGAKLTEKQVVEIRVLGEEYKAKIIGEMFGMSRGSINAILRGVTWQHI